MKLKILLFVSTIVLCAASNLDLRAQIHAHDTTDLELQLIDLYGLRLSKPDSVNQVVTKILAEAPIENIYARAYAHYLLQTINTSWLDSLAYQMHYKTAKELYSKVQDSVGISFTLHQHGNYLVENMQLDSANHIYKQDLALKQRLGDKDGIAYALTGLGIVADLQGNWSEAVTQYLAAIKIFEEVDIPREVATNQHNLSVVYYNQGRFEDAANIERKAITYNKQKQFLYPLGMNYVCLATYLSEQDSLEEALQIATEAVAIGLEIDNDAVYDYGTATLAEIYGKSGRGDEAKSMYDRLTARLEGTGRLAMAAEVELKRSRAALKRNETESAVDFAKQAEQKFATLGLPYEQSKALEILKEASAKTGNFEQAYQTSKLYIELRDTLFARDQTQAIAEAEAKFESVKSRALLAEAETQAVRQRQTLYLWIGGFLAIALVAIILALLARQRKHLLTKQQKLNQLMEQERLFEQKLNSELNHRTSNQISLAYELILDQRRQIGDEQAKASLERSESQLMALREVNRALAHRSDDLVRADEVLTKVAENLQAASPYPFELDLQLKAISVHGNAASRSALILSELLSNSIKYAFPNTEHAKATISLSQSAEGTTISYSDNGPGADGTVKGTGVGTGLIEAMLEDLDAEFEEGNSADGKGYGIRWWWRWR